MRRRSKWKRRMGEEGRWRGKGEGDEEGGRKDVVRRKGREIRGRKVEMRTVGREKE